MACRKSRLMKNQRLGFKPPFFPRLKPSQLAELTVLI
jgi:hypothetical protein